MPPEIDLLIIGGGINGAAIARDAAGRGLRVLLCEQDDLASHTSSASTKLVHGGLRYLEYFEFALVRKALIERELLLRSAPHLIRPLRFVLPHQPDQRPAWLIRAGLFLYDHLARRELLPGSESIDLRQHIAGAALDPRFTRGFAYSDAWVDDARLVVANAIDARERGARILTRTRCVAAQRQASHWDITLHDVATGREWCVPTRAVVNAAGPWVGTVLGHTLGVTSRQRVRLIQGSHIIVPRQFTHDHAYLFQNADRRILFCIPYEGAFTLIGTTDVELTEAPRAAAISNAEIDYLCTMASRVLRTPIHPGLVRFTYSGTRALLEDDAARASAVTRDYLLDLDRRGAPVMSIFGGKITTSRKLAEEAVDRLVGVPGLSGRARPNKRPWTATHSLPGGDIAGADFARFQAALQARHPWLPEALLHRWSRAYGTRVSALLGTAAGMADLGAEVAPGLHACELAYLRDQEWAHTAEDVLWRRSKLGLHLHTHECAAVAAWMADAASRPRGQS